MEHPKPASDLRDAGPKLLDGSRPSKARFVLRPIKARRTFEMIIERIVEGIEAYGLGVGDRLPNEGVLAQMLEVSRPTIRQGLRVLENSGLLRVKAGMSGGIFVASDMIPLDVLNQNVALEAGHVSELIATRRLIEPIIYHLAAENATMSELDKIEETVELMRRHIGDARMMRRADGMFHRRIAHASGNRTLLRVMVGIYRELNPLRDALRYEEAKGRHMIDVHVRQLRAMRIRDHRLLEAAVQETFVDLEKEFGVPADRRFQWRPAPASHVGARTGP